MSRFILGIALSAASVLVPLGAFAQAAPPSSTALSAYQKAIAIYRAQVQAIQVSFRAAVAAAQLAYRTALSKSTTVAQRSDASQALASAIIAAAAARTAALLALGPAPQRPSVHAG